MEEKVLIQSTQYNIKKTAKKISCIIFALSIIASAFMLISYYTENLIDIKSDYEEHYLPSVNNRIDEYNEIIEYYENNTEKTIYCEHTKYEIKYFKSGKSYESAIPMTKDEFLEIHPDAKSYTCCKNDTFKWYENFDEYKNAQTVLYRWEIDFSLIPLCANGLIIFVVLIYLWLRSYSITVTNKRVYGQTAFGKRVDLPFDSVSSVGTSALKGIAVGTSSGKISFKLIKNQSEIHDVISKLLSERQTSEKKTSEPTVTQTVVESSSADEIKKFKELLDMGVISQEEFDEKKKQLLNL